MKQTNLIFSLVLITLLISNSQAQILLGHVDSNANEIDKTFSVNMHVKVGEVNPLLWGANFLFWIEDDAALEIGRASCREIV